MGHGDHHHHGHAPFAQSPESPSGAHKAQAPARVAAYVVTCSDSRAEADDETGRILRSALEAAGHPLCGYRVVRDEPEAIRAVLEAAAEVGARAVIINGGTGIGRRDVTIETVRPLLDKELPGFGELFRALSYEQIGSAAMMTRALAGTWRGALVFCLPGSPAAARLAMDALILPELGHGVRELSR